jgi:hypothetical protein
LLSIAMKTRHIQETTQARSSAELEFNSVELMDL